MGQEQGEPPQGTVTTDSDNKQTGEKHTHGWHPPGEAGGKNRRLMGLALSQGPRHSEPPIATHYLDSVGKFLLLIVRLTLPICKVEGMNQRALLRVPFPVKLVSPYQWLLCERI